MGLSSLSELDKVSVYSEFGLDRCLFDTGYGKFTANGLLIFDDTIP